MDNKHEDILEVMEAMLKIQLDSVGQLLLGRGANSTVQSIRRRQRKRKYLVDLVVEILTSEKRPIHVDELVELLQQRFGRPTDRDSLASALAKKATQGVLVQRVTPATYALRQGDKSE